MAAYLWVTGWASAGYAEIRVTVVMQASVPQQEWGAGSSCPQDWTCQLTGWQPCPREWSGSPLGCLFSPFLFPVLDLCSYLCLTWSTFWERGFQMRQSRWPWLECVPRVHADTVLWFWDGQGLFCLGECPQWGQCLWESWSRGSSEAWTPSHDGNQRTVPLTFLSSHSRWLS